MNRAQMRADFDILRRENMEEEGPDGHLERILMALRRVNGEPDEGAPGPLDLILAALQAVNAA